MSKELNNQPESHDQNLREEIYRAYSRPTPGINIIETLRSFPQNCTWDGYTGTLTYIDKAQETSVFDGNGRLILYFDLTGDAGLRRIDRNYTKDGFLTREVINYASGQTQEMELSYQTVKDQKRLAGAEIRKFQGQGNFKKGKLSKITRFTF